MAGFIGAYVHSDSTTPHKGAALASVRGGGEAFAAMAARFCFAASAAQWQEVAAVFPDAEAARTAAGAEIAGAVVARLSRGEAGRVEVAADGRGAVAVKVLTLTDFAAKTPALARFAAAVAAEALRTGATDWRSLADAAPHVEEERAALARSLRETVAVAEMLSLRVPA